MESENLQPIQFETKPPFVFSLGNEVSVMKWLEEVARQHNYELSSLEYVFCDDEQLLQINKEYLNHDYYTDIITFPLDTDPLEACIYISVDRVRDNAKIYKSSFVDELHRVIVHGLLHLIGHNDKTNEESQAMRKAEDDCLSQRNFI